MKFSLLTFAGLAAIATGIAAIPIGPNAGVEAQHGRMAGRMSITYVNKAAASDMYEIQSARLASTRAHRPAVRQFAMMLATDHSRTTQLLTEAARSDGLAPPPPMLEPAQRTMLRQLERARDRDFERLYLGQQVTAHQMALSLHRTYARSGDGRALRRVASSAVPIVQGHLTEARQLERGR
jgi:putative membrane protein